VGVIKARRLEKVLVDLAGRTEVRQLLVVRAIELGIDCGCYKYGHHPKSFTVIYCYDPTTQSDSCYVRANGEHAFRTIDIAGPITVSCDTIYSPDV
jgi:hypothetical protein